jgi:hypothetical protein
MTENEQLQDADKELELALDIIDSLNELWNWSDIHKNDESEFRRVQAFLDKHGHRSQRCEF